MEKEEKKMGALERKIRENEELEKKHRRKIFKIVFIIVLILVIIDQGTKFAFVNKNIDVISNVLKFNTVQNRGGAFGVGQKSTFSFIVANIIVLGIILKFISMQAKQLDKKTIFALSLVLGGGVSNLIDRLFKGYVVDFIDINGLFNFPNFNLADVYVVIGFVLLALFFAMFANNVRMEKNKKVKDDKSGEV